MSGALAVAGSIFILVKINGKSIPIRLPIITVNTIVKETTTIIPGDLNQAMAATPTAIVNPRNNETITSLPINKYQSDNLTSPMAVFKT